MLDHRVVTLHPKIHGGILADLGKDVAPRRPRGSTASTPFDLVVSNLYPFLERPGDRARSTSAARRWCAPRRRTTRGSAIVTSPDAVRRRCSTSCARDGALVRRRPAARSRSRRSRAPPRTTPRSSSGSQADEALPAAPRPRRSSGPTRRCATARTRTSTARATGCAARTSWWDGVAQHSGLALSYLNFYDTDAAWQLVHDLGDRPGRARSSSTRTRAASRSPTTSPPRTSARWSATSAPRSAGSSR